ncbi:outer membrane beta-barrel protein [Vibrio hangzhouensis]|uniref:Outer membrane protein beta-barrel domain-containing protein n=1 Tax=Vibrio hangzhouensis TaxID=462991 RepID=A0A1H5TMI6_9VIBR|nr:outer membrane beta-barrel protein [Vibrio hangzhouensis]SEF64025.1 Outer membrane protein beta-barrel domain-containing protein [Vibrio hangzhouensis]
MNTTRIVSAGALAALLFTAGQAYASPFSERDSLEFTLGGYLLTQNIDADIGTPQQLELGFGDIADNLENAFTVYTGLQNGKWGIYLDYSNIGLSKSNPSYLGGVLSQGDIDIRLIDAYATYQIDSGDRWYLDVTFGARNFDHQLSLTPQGAPSPVSLGDNWTHATLGLKHQIALGENWYWSTHGDIGTDFSSSNSYKLTTGAGYDWHNGWEALVSYKILKVDHETGSPTEPASYYKYDALEHGLMLGVSYTF